MILKILIIAVGLVAILSFADRLQQRKIEGLRRRGLYPLEGQETEAHVDSLIQMGRKIEAIKVYRKLHGVGLKEAKEAVEERARQLPRQ